MRRFVPLLSATFLLLATAVLSQSPPRAPQPDLPGAYVLVGWNDLGMHCMDGGDYSVSTILPPYNNLFAQLKNRSGALVTNPAGITVTYEAVADPAGSINTSSASKTNFWTYAQSLFGFIFGGPFPPDVGLSDNAMPGPSNVPQPMAFDAAHSWFHAEGIPISPVDDAGARNNYPTMKLVARDSGGNVLASTTVVVPVSDEMDCRTCHASGSPSPTVPSGGWAWNPDANKDFKLNILALHDDRNLGNPAYAAALASAGYSAQGLKATSAGGTPVFCQRCHATNALPGSGLPGIPPLNQAIHTLHSAVVDPTNGLVLDSINNRNACYRCHPGSQTRCLRGAMGKAVAADGTMEMQCQSCHHSMARVGSPDRQGWLSEPGCQNCHTGNAVQNSGQIRYTSAYDGSGQLRQPASTVFATNPDVPAPGYSLYRLSKGHGDLGCEACHGSTHAEFPSSHTNDNLQSIAVQGHTGVIGECTACHATVPSTVTGGPHGMHPVGQSWVSGHKSPGQNASQCRACHGTDYRGTVLSRTFGDRALSTEWGTKNAWKGATVGCYMCHQGPTNTSRNSNRAPVVANASAETLSGQPVAIPLSASDADGNTLTLRIVSQPLHGTAGLSGTTATYFPEPGYLGSDTFTAAAWDGSIDSALATITVSVTGAGCSLDCVASAPESAAAGSPVPFSASVSPVNCGGQPSLEWDFGDGGRAFVADPTHVYAAPGLYQWTLRTTAGASVCVKQGYVNALSAGPPPVPSGVAPMEVRPSTSGGLTVTWDAVNCASTQYHLVYGFGSGLSSWTVGGGACGLGSTGSYTWTGSPDPAPDSSRFLWFVVAGDDGAGNEGSWGLTSGGQERGGGSPSGVCGVTAKAAGVTCAAP